MEREVCEICMRFSQAENSTLCESCKGVQDHWRSEAKRMGLTLGEYLIKTSKWN